MLQSLDRKTDDGKFRRRTGFDRRHAAGRVADAVLQSGMMPDKAWPIGLAFRLSEIGLGGYGGGKRITGRRGRAADRLSLNPAKLREHFAISPIQKPPALQLKPAALPSPLTLLHEP